VDVLPVAGRLITRYGDVESVTAVAEIDGSIFPRQDVVRARRALLFGGLLTGTSTRNLDPEIFKPELASNLTIRIQGLVVLFVGADIIVLWLIARARRRRPAT